MGPCILNQFSIIVQQNATMYSLLYFCKLLYRFRWQRPSTTRPTTFHVRKTRGC